MVRFSSKNDPNISESTAIPNKTKKRSAFYATANILITKLSLSHLTKDDISRSRTHYCPCDSEKSKEKLKIETQCHCEEIDFEEELILFFLNEILRKVLYERYIDDATTVSIKKKKPYAMTVKTSQDLSKSNLRRSSIKDERHTAEHKKRAHQRSPKITKKEKSKTDLSFLHSIHEDNQTETAEKVIAITDFEQDWLVTRDEKSAKITFKNGNKYEGEVFDKVPHGKGTFWWADGTIYEGEFLDGTPTGRGTMKLPDLSYYTGSFYQGNFHGEGVLNIQNTNMIYSGEWRYGKKHGLGWLMYEPGVLYEGEFKNNLRDGRGFYKFGKNNCYEGYYVKNKREGRGAMRWPNNDVYIGEWSEGNIHGFGEYSWRTVFDNTFTFPVQHFYKGTWENNKRNGTGVMFFGNENGAKMAGLFRNNRKHGPAIVVCGNGKSIEGNPLFIDDKPIHSTCSADDLTENNNSMAAFLNKQHYQKIAQTGTMQEEWLKRRHRTSQVTAELLEDSKQEKSDFCNPIEIQIAAAPEDIDLTFYIDKALNMYVNAFDTIQFDIDSNDSSLSSSRSSGSRYHEFSKWNLLTLNTMSYHQPSKMNRTCETLTILRKNSVGQANFDLRTSDGKFSSLIQNEEKYIRNVIIRHLPKLMEIYYHYATITTPKKDYFKHFMIRMFLWQMYLDIGITEMGISLVEIDDFLNENPSSFVESSHHPFEHIYFYQFIQSLLGAALLVHNKKKEEVQSNEGLTPYIFQKFLLEILFKKFGSHKGRCLFEFKNLLPMKKVYALYLTIGESHTARTFLNAACTRKGEEPADYKLKPRNQKLEKIFLGINVNSFGHNLMYIPEKKEVGTRPEELLENSEENDPFFQDISTLRILGPKLIVQCLCAICPSISQNGLICNINYPMTFLEFYEVLLQCTLLVVAKIRKSNIDDVKMDDLDDENASKKGSIKMKRKK